MQIKQQLKNIALKALGFVADRLPMAAGFFGNIFAWMGWNGIVGYNNKIVYAGLNILVRKLTEPPQIVSKVKNERKLKSFYSHSVTNEKRALLKVQSLTELDNHELNLLLENPNAYQTGIELREQFWFNYQYGDGYIIAVNEDVDSPGPESRRYKPKSFMAINRNRVTPIKSFERYRPIKEYRITLFNGEQLTLPPEQVFHLRKWNPESDTEGAGFQYAAGKTISENDANVEARGAAFVNGGRGTLFTSDTTIHEGQIYQKMSKDQMSNLKDTMMADIIGARNNRRQFFTNGYVKAENYGDTLAEMELIDADKSNWKDVYGVLGIPISLAPTGDGLTDTNQAAGYKGLVTNVIISDLRKFDMKFNHWIAPWYGPEIRVSHDLTEFNELAPDLKLMKEVYGDADYITQNEKRTLFNYDTDDKTEGMNGYLVSGSKKTLEQVIDGAFQEPVVDPMKQYDYR